VKDHWYRCAGIVNCAIVIRRDPWCASMYSYDRDFKDDERGSDLLLCDAAIRHYVLVVGHRG